MSVVEFYFNKKLPVQLIQETFAASYGLKLDIDYWNWRFIQNPNHHKVYISYILENNKLAAYYAVSPMKIIIDSNQFDIALSNMTMTHPDFQGKGYFKLIAGELYNALKNDGFIGVYGFANSNSHYGFRKYLNWFDLSLLNNFCVDKNSFRSFLVPDAEHLEFDDVELTTSLLNILPELSVTDKLISISRNKENLRWRLANNTEHNYKVLVIKNKNKVVGYIPYKKFKNGIDLMEIFIDQNYVSNNIVMGNAFKQLLEIGYSEINIWSNLFSTEHLFLEKVGFKESGFNTYFGVIPFDNDKRLLNYKNWHYRFFDSDIY